MLPPGHSGEYDDEGAHQHGKKRHHDGLRRKPHYLPRKGRQRGKEPEEPKDYPWLLAENNPDHLSQAVKDLSHTGYRSVPIAARARRSRQSSRHTQALVPWRIPASANVAGRGGADLEYSARIATWRPPRKDATKP